MARDFYIYASLTAAPASDDKADAVPRQHAFHVGLLVDADRLAQRVVFAEGVVGAHAGCFLGQIVLDAADELGRIAGVDRIRLHVARDHRAGADDDVVADLDQPVVGVVDDAAFQHVEVGAHLHAVVPVVLDQIGFVPRPTYRGLEAFLDHAFQCCLHFHPCCGGAGGPVSGLRRHTTLARRTAARAPFIAVFYVWRMRIYRSSHTPDLAQSLC